jgi:outer membrane protein assembly factor BamB
MNFTVKDISIIRGISQASGIFTLIVALIMIFSLAQLKTINPLDNPALLSIKEQYDSNPEAPNIAEQVRAMDLMARKAYFATRRQVETGSYLLVAGAVIFIFCQRLIAGNEKLMPAISDHGQISTTSKYRKYLLISASIITFGAIVSSFLLRSNLPDLSVSSTGAPVKKREKIAITEFKPDKTNYPFFRGQDSRGIAGGSGYPTDWNGEEGRNIKWKIPVPGIGKSSPVIWERKLFITGTNGAACEVYCINKETGEKLWTAPASGIPGEPAVPPETDQDAGLAVSTAAVNNKAVCAIFANGNLVCLDHDGKSKWAKNIGTPNNAYGYTSSLIIFDNTLIVQFDAQDKISLMGFDIESGTMKWETIRTGHPVWSSPVLATFNGTPQIVVNGNPSVTSFNAKTGEELWTVECLTGDVAPSVAVNSTMTYAVTDYARLAAIKAGSGAAIVWEDNTFTPDVSSPVATDEFLFLTTGNGDAACYNAVKGDTLWTHYFADSFYASPVIADEKVYLLDRAGMMHIVKAGGEYVLMAESPLGENADCTPAFSDKNIYIRGRNNIYCISEN